MSDVEYWPYGTPALLSLEHPEHGDVRDRLGSTSVDADDVEALMDGLAERSGTTPRVATEVDVADVVRLLQPGDCVLWPGRTIPLDVVDVIRTGTHWTDAGVREINFRLEGSHGGEYRLTNWVHWGNEDQEGPADATGPWPQVHRTSASGSSLELHVPALAADGPFHRGTPPVTELAPGDRIVYEKAVGGRGAGVVERIEFGDPIIRPINWDDDVERAVARVDVVAWRGGHDD